MGPTMSKSEVSLSPNDGTTYVAMNYEQLNRRYNAIPFFILETIIRKNNTNIPMKTYLKNIRTAFLDQIECFYKTSEPIMAGFDRFVTITVPDKLTIRDNSPTKLSKLDLVNKWNNYKNRFNISITKEQLE